jgi:hypothetical protein
MLGEARSPFAGVGYFHPSFSIFGASFYDILLHRVVPASMSPEAD